MTLALASGSVERVTLSLGWCWLASGLWVLSDEHRAQRAGLRMSVLGSRLARGGALLALAGALLPLLRSEGTALGLVALLLVLMAVLSLAVLVFPLRPRWYLVSVAGAGVLALLGCVLA